MSGLPFDFNLYMRCIETKNSLTTLKSSTIFNLYMRCIETRKDDTYSHSLFFLTYTWDVLKQIFKLFIVY